MPQTTTHIFGSEYPQKTIPLIQNAKIAIDIITYAWRWYPDDIGCSIMRFNNALIKKAQRGVRIRAITQSVEIVKYLRSNGIEVKSQNLEKIIHGKLMLIDEDIVVIGSHNFTKNAFERNLELSIIFKNEQTNKEYKSFFNNLWLL